MTTKRVTTGAIVAGGFRAVRERPGSAIAWGVLYLVMFVGGTLLLVRPIIRAQLAAANAGMSAQMALLGWIYLYDFAIFVLLTILFAAAVRAVLRPEEKFFFFVRLGADELRLTGLFLILLLAYFLLFIACAIVGALIGALTVPADPATVAIVTIGGMLVSIFPILFFQVRLSPAAALTILRRKIIIGEAWRLTRGHFWSLFGGYLLVWLMLLVGYLVVAGLTLGPYLTELARGGFTMQSLHAAGQHQVARQLGGIDPLMALGWIVTGLVTGLGIAIWAGALGTATNGLLGTTEVDYAETFA